MQNVPFDSIPATPQDRTYRAKDVAVGEHFKDAAIGFDEAMKTYGQSFFTRIETNGEKADGIIAVSLDAKLRRGFNNDFVVTKHVILCHIKPSEKKTREDSYTVDESDPR
jgi:hypothetical protein